MTITSTGWKSPLTINQDDRRAVNNNHACYTWADLNDIKADNLHYAYIPTSGGIDSIRASPVIYAYNYNFQIPTNATIKSVYVLPVTQQANGAKYGKVTKLKTLKLKTGTSLTDYGVGNNLANNTYIQTTKVPLQTWSNESTWTYNGKYVFEGDNTVWGTSLTPQIINSTTFGCVFQVIGTEYKKWVTPEVAKLQMKVEYEIPETVTSKVENTPSSVSTSYQIDGNNVSFADGVSSKLYEGLNVDDKNGGVTVKVNYVHSGQQAESPIISVSASNILISSQKVKSYTLPTLHFSDDESAKTYSQSFVVYPNFVGGEQYLQIKSPTETRIIRFNITSASYSSMNDVEKKKYLNDGQFCKITNCSFKRNSATGVNGEGGAMYILTEHFQYGGNVYGTGVDVNKVGKSGGIVNLDWNDKKIE